VGVSSTNPKSSIMILKKMEHYNDWEFIYDPSLELGGGGALLNQPAPGPPLSGSQPGAQLPVGTNPQTPSNPAPVTPTCRSR